MITTSYEVLLLAKKCVSILQPRKFDAELSAALVKRPNLSIEYCPLLDFGDMRAILLLEQKNY